MTNKDLTYIAFVLDRSGSMMSVASDTVGGFNSFIKDQREQPGACRVTLTQFDTVYEIVYQNKPIGDVPPLDFHPRGRTALYDAMARTIIETGEQLATVPEAERPANVYLITLTDGLENASQEFSADTLRRLIERQRNQYQWQFVFLGANQDAILTAQDLGMLGQAAMEYLVTPEGTRGAYAATSASVARSRKSGQSVSFTDEEREQAMQKGQ
jgi:hypothetical protein